MEVNKALPSPLKALERLPKSLGRSKLSATVNQNPPRGCKSSLAALPKAWLLLLLWKAAKPVIKVR